MLPRKSSILIGSYGFSYDSWSEVQNNVPNFYPNVKDKLQFYSKKFDTVSLTIDRNTSDETIEGWIHSVRNNPRFKFCIFVPDEVTKNRSSKTCAEYWSKFWYDQGCEKIYKSGKLGCVILHFDSNINFSDRHFRKLEKIVKKAPKDLRIVFDFTHSSWWENPEKTKSYFSKHKNWCVSTPLVENGLLKFGWSGNLRSTRTKHGFTPLSKGPPIIISSDFVHIFLNGTYGPGIGSYDKNNFLERFANVLGSLNVETVFCTFKNTVESSTFCYPLPKVLISGFVLIPQIEELPEHAEDRDLPCCLHDMFRLKALLLEKSTIKYELDDEGYVNIMFENYPNALARKTKK